MHIPGYPHEIEYRRERSKGYRDHLYTELADDMGFCLVHREDRKEAYLVGYATACAEDFLGRVNAPRGTWVVSVYRRWPEPARDHVVTIRLRWAP
ncbi:hypothetical protein [Amycolatopsis cihanbeyliensis]|uniref:Uncharacterized protein n=1 Tax=Amycolatopsis cihanbeyliensis TaxID=1128664 RepID=A0A542DGG3_AMYCI|nr:hypothetical protein [Amycolatopsis cihanbeyliensis]TQJ02179.1 hypothetical protein FB471_1897 [Amycolatopsis cihanbeyliensis]